MVTSTVWCSSCWLELALFGGLFPCFVASSWAWLPIHTSRICYNSVVSPTESSRISQGSRVYTLGHSALDGEASKEGMGGALPRWRPPPHPIYESSTVWWRLHFKLDLTSICLGSRFSIGSLQLPVQFKVLALVICINRGSLSSIRVDIFV